MDNNKQKNFLITVCILAVTVIITELLYIYTIMDQNLILFYILAVVLIARYTSGYIYGVGASVLSCLIFDYLITYPRHGFSISVSFPLTLILMLIVSIIICTITVRMKKQAALYHEREKRSNIMSQMHEHLLIALDIDAIARIAVKYTTMQLDEPVVFFAKTPINDEIVGFSRRGSFLYDPEEKKRAQDMFHSEDDVNDIYYEDKRIYYMRIRGKNKIVGMLGVHFKKKPMNENDKIFIKDLLSQIIIAMELLVVTGIKNAIELEQERDRTKSILLRAVSHDLRTPLTGILGQSTFLRDNAELLSDEEVKQYANDISDNSQWLIRMVENLLSVTRISDSTMEVKKTNEVVEEIMGEAASIVRKRFRNCNIILEAPSEPVTMMMDAILITQVLINIIENAVKYAPENSKVWLKMRKKGSDIVFQIMDEGFGLSENLLANISRGIPMDGIVDSKNGLGLGLLICTTIVNSHGGKITAQNRVEKGSVFTITIPER